MLGREILITGDEILYRDVVAGQPKPAWKKGPSVNLSVLPFPEATTRMQVSGNQYMQLSDLQAFFAKAFSDIEHDHDGVYDAAGTAAQLIGELATVFGNHTANHAPSNAQANVIESMSIGGVEVPITNKKLAVAVDDSVTVTLSNGVMTVAISDAYKKKITLAQFM